MGQTCWFHLSPVARIWYITIIELFVGLPQQLRALEAPMRSHSLHRCKPEHARSAEGGEGAAESGAAGSPVRVQCGAQGRRGWKNCASRSTRDLKLATSLGTGQSWLGTANKLPT